MASRDRTGGQIAAPDDRRRPPPSKVGREAMPQRPVTMLGVSPLSSRWLTASARSASLETAATSVRRANEYP